MSIDASGAVTVTPATEAERALIECLFQFYVYDFSELEPPDSDKCELSANGRFAVDPYLEGYWRDDGRVALIIRRVSRLVGFALINAESHSGLAVDRNMAEFFVMRKHRRSGVASAAVRAILTRFPGRWDIAVAQRNAGARAFWPVAVAATPGVSDLTTLAGDRVHWTGPILRLRADG